MTYEQLLEDIRKKKFYPVYFLTGEEPYFIDQLAGTLENAVLDPVEREFNQTVVYGNDVNVPSVLDLARRYPMFSPYHVIIVKEAQDIREIESLAPYIEKPVPTTILVLCYKYKKLDKRKSFAKSLQSKAAFFESKKLYDNQVTEWIIKQVRSMGYVLDPKAAVVLTDHIGSDLSRMIQEIQKLMVNLPPGSTISTDHIEMYIGISKDYNVFELQKAIGERNILKANQIAFFMAANPKENPIQKIIPVLYSFFAKVLIYHSLTDKSNPVVTSALGISSFFIGDYQRAAQQYQPNKLETIISVLRDYDLRSKGVNNISTEDNELVREMMYKIMH